MNVHDPSTNDLAEESLRRKFVVQSGEGVLSALLALGHGDQPPSGNGASSEHSYPPPIPTPPRHTSSTTNPDTLQR